MPDTLTTTDPADFGLTRFSDLLPAREHIIGEDPGSFDRFRESMTRALAPMTPYEHVIAEHLIAIEWELIQHRRMRDAGLRRIMSNAIRKAVVARENAAHEAGLDAKWDAHVEAGGTEDDFWPSASFDRDAAEAKGDALAARAVSRDAVEFEAACEEIASMGLDVVDLMGEAYRTSCASVGKHDFKGRELEGRRREVRRDLDALRKARPVDAEVIEG